MSSDTGSAHKKKRYISNIITLKAGKGEDSITIHEDLLRDNSPFFKAALEGKWAESQAREVKLPEDSVEVVTTYIDWLYRKRVNVGKLKERPDHHFLAELYCFGEKVQDDSFCNTTLASWLRQIDETQNYPSTTSVSIIYDGTPPDSLIRSCLVQIFAAKMDVGWAFGEDDYPAAFVMQLLRMLVGRRAKSAGVFHKRRKEWYKKK